MMRKTLLDIAHSGVLAPSADNQHVFQIELGESGIHLWPAGEFAEATALYRRVLGLISLGAVVENMKLRAGQLGFNSSVHWQLTSHAGPIVQIDFQAEPAIAVDELAAAIPARHTNRRMYRGPGLNEREAALLNAAVESVEGVRLIWLHGAARRRALWLIWHAESERFLRQRLHHEIFSSVRFDLPWHESADWGLPPGSLEIEMPMRSMFKALRHWGLMRTLTWAGVHHLIGLRSGWLPCWQAPALGLLVTSLPMEEGAVAAGAAFERLWLRAALLGFSMQPMAASTVLMSQTPSDCGSSQELRAILESGWQTITQLNTPLMVFRMGRATRPSVTTGRKPLSEHMRGRTSA